MLIGEVSRKMPTNIRAGLSVVVAIVAVVAFFLESQVDSGVLRWIVLGLAAFMIWAVWLFPEAKSRRERSKE